jgi:predicted NAD/FAD-dependent oxidoreductase
VDHGLVFYHGSDEGFLADLDRADPAGRLDGWPVRVRGEGHPCQPRAFARDERRLAFAGGVNVFPRYLANGLDVRLETTVTGMRPDGAALRFFTARSGEFRAPVAVVALPAPQALRLVEPFAEEEPAMRPGRALLGLVGSSACLTVMAGYDREASEADWDVCYPEGSGSIQTICHDSAKRVRPSQRVVVLQALPAWSRRRIEDPPDAWSRDLLRDAASLIGDWAAQPAWSQAHRWRFARVDHGSEFTAPPVFEVPGGARIGLAGEAFSPGGGVQAAWTSGRAVARSILER